LTRTISIALLELTLATHAIVYTNVIKISKILLSFLMYSPFPYNNQLGKGVSCSLPFVLDHQYYVIFM